MRNHPHSAHYVPLSEKHVPQNNTIFKYGELNKKKKTEQRERTNCN